MTTYEYDYEYDYDYDYDSMHACNYGTQQNFRWENHKAMFPGYRIVAVVEYSRASGCKHVPEA